MNYLIGLCLLYGEKLITERTRKDLSRHLSARVFQENVKKLLQIQFYFFKIIFLMGHTRKWFVFLLITLLKKTN